MGLFAVATALHLTFGALCRPAPAPCRRPCPRTTRRFGRPRRRGPCPRRTPGSGVSAGDHPRGRARRAASARPAPPPSTPTVWRWRRRSPRPGARTPIGAVESPGTERTPARVDAPPSGPARGWPLRDATRGRAVSAFRDTGVSSPPTATSPGSWDGLDSQAHSRGGGRRSCRPRGTCSATTAATF